ncbi:MAG: hypothetical protein P9L99_10895 [Candidatus Lernaella stagnicola]|nr:hypothetical protein [Candidatus Lernaella stagnicola]
MVRRASIVVVALCLAMLAACAGEVETGAGFEVGIEDAFYPWRGTVRADSFEAKPGEEWHADFDIEIDFRRLREYPDVVKGVAVVLVGEQVYDEDGITTGLTATALSSRFTSAGVPIAYYEGTLPVRALGNQRGSPFEAATEFRGDSWTRGGRGRFKGRLSAVLPPDIPPGFYRPHVNVFVKFAGSNTPIDLAHLPVRLEQWLVENIRTGGTQRAHEALRGRMPPDMREFMQAPQVLPAVQIGEPAPPRVAWTVFQDVEEYGQSGILANEDKESLGLISRVRLPTPLTLLPRQYRVNPGIPKLYPETALADLFIGRSTVPSRVKNFMDFGRVGAKADEGPYADAKLTGPDGTTLDLGRRLFVGEGSDGPLLENSGFTLDLRETGDYRLELTGRMFDQLGRGYEAGGTYDFTVALPLSFSTPVKPGTNFLEGARFPAVAHINPPVPAEVTVDVEYVPQSDMRRRVVRSFRGKANRFGHFVPQGQAPLVMSEPGEYRSLVTAQYRDEQGVLWQGAQASAGVVAEHDPEIVLHGGRTYLQPPRLGPPHYGGKERYDSRTEGGSSFLFLKFLTQYDYTLPYHSGDTLFAATTYPYETVIGIVLSMEAKTKQLARRIVEAYNPSGQPLNFPAVSLLHQPELLPDLFKISDDNFGYHRITAEQPDHLPILSASERGWSPMQFPDKNTLEAYAYISVIRPGFSVMTMAFTGSLMGPCWIIAPNSYGGQINTSPNGDLPGDLYRVMAGLVFKDKITGENHYDAYASTIIASPPGSYANAVTAPGERPLMSVNGRDQYYFIGLDTSESFLVGEQMVLGGTVMPPVAADVAFTVTRPDGSQVATGGRSNRLGGFVAPDRVAVDQPGVYRVGVKIQGEHTSGDVAGSGDGEYFHFAVPEDEPKLLNIELPVFSRVKAGEDVVVPLSWPAELTDAKITYSIMMPGTVLDEGVREVSGADFRFRLNPTQLAIQYPFIDTVDFATGRKLYADTIVMVFFLEATRGGQKTYDVVRIILRGDRLFNSRPAPGMATTMPHTGPLQHPPSVGVPPPAPAFHAPPE